MNNLKDIITNYLYNNNIKINDKTLYVTNDGKSFVSIFSSIRDCSTMFGFNVLKELDIETITNGNSTIRLNSDKVPMIGTSNHGNQPNQVMFKREFDKYGRVIRIIEFNRMYDFFYGSKDSNFVKINITSNIANNTKPYYSDTLSIDKVNNLINCDYLFKPAYNKYLIEKEVNEYLIEKEVNNK